MRTKRGRRGITLATSCVCKSSVCKPSSVLDGYLSRPVVTDRFKRIYRDVEQTFNLISCAERGLQERFVAKAFVGSYPAFPPLQQLSAAVYFCCTFL